MTAVRVRTIAGVFALVCVLVSAGASADESLARQLIDRISRSESELQALEKKVSRESTRYAREVDAKESEVKKLREQAAALQRLMDEKLLGIDKLESRVDEWTTQSNYQKHLLAGYAEGVGLSVLPPGSVDGDSEIDPALLDRAVAGIESALSPTWRDKQIIAPDGEVITSAVLNAGPVEVAFDPASDTGGPVLNEANTEPRIATVYDRSDVRELQSLYDSGLGFLTFDPTLGNALELHNRDKSLFGHLGKGGIWAVPILFFGLLSFVISVLKGVEFLRLPKIDPTLADRIQSHPHAERKQYFSAQTTGAVGAQQKLVDIAGATPVSQQRDDLLVAYLMEYKHKLERFMGVIGTSAAVAPLLGLLGTVSGMISTFKMMTIFGSGDASTVSGGISEALVTTELGLIVAIPSLVVSALLARKSKSYNHELEKFAIKLSKIEFAGR